MIACKEVGSKHFILDVKVNGVVADQMGAMQGAPTNCEQTHGVAMDGR